MADLLQRDGKVIQGPQGSADEEIDKQNVETEEQSEHDEAIAEIVPDFEDLVGRIGFANNATIIVAPNHDWQSGGGAMPRNRTNQGGTIPKCDPPRSLPRRRSRTREDSGLL